MVTQIFSDSTTINLFGLSTDIKPLDVPNGSTFTEIDTSNEYKFDAENLEWFLQ